MTLIEHFYTDEIFRREVANLYKSGESFLNQEPHLLKNNTTVDLKNFKSVGVP
jgi:hypothetical protein